MIEEPSPFGDIGGLALFAVLAFALGAGLIVWLFL
jgi:hypothetical protein